MVSTTFFGAYLLIKMRILILIYSEINVSHQLWGKWAIYVVLCLILNPLEEHCTVSALTCNKNPFGLSESVYVSQNMFK